MKETYCTTFCNKLHRLVDGKPVDHECFVLPTEALKLEKEGNVSSALAILNRWNKRRIHRGVRAKTREGTT